MTDAGPEEPGSHVIYAVATAESGEHQRDIGNDLSMPVQQSPRAF